MIATHLAYGRRSVARAVFSGLLAGVHGRISAFEQDAGVVSVIRCNGVANRQPNLAVVSA